MCVIDNLIKGAGGQAVQAMNLALGLDERAGLLAPGPIAMLTDTADRRCSRCTPPSRSGRPWPRLLAGRRGRQRVARCLRRARRGHRPLPSRRGPGDRRAGRDAALLLDRGAARRPGAAGVELIAPRPRSARQGLLLQLRRGGERERARCWRAQDRAAGGRVAAGRLARPHRGDPGLHRRREVRGRGPPGRRCRSRARCRSTTSPRSMRRSMTRWPRCCVEPVQGFAGARRLHAGIPPGRPADLRPSAAPSCCSTRSSAASGAAARSPPPNSSAWCPTRSTMAKGLAAGLPIGAVVARRLAGRRHQASATSAHLRRRAGALRRRARQPRRDRSRGTARERPHGRWRTRLPGAGLPHGAPGPRPRLPARPRARPPGSEVQQALFARGSSPAPPPIPIRCGSCRRSRFRPTRPSCCFAGLREVLA